MKEHTFNLPLAILDDLDAIYIVDVDGIVLAECTHYADGQDKSHRIERLKKIIEPVNTYSERESLMKEFAESLETARKRITTDTGIFCRDIGILYDEKLTFHNDPDMLKITSTLEKYKAL